MWEILYFYAHNHVGKSTSRSSCPHWERRISPPCLCIYYLTSKQIESILFICLSGNSALLIMTGWRNESDFTGKGCRLPPAGKAEEECFFCVLYVSFRLYTAIVGISDFPEMLFKSFPHGWLDSETAWMETGGRFELFPVMEMCNKTRWIETQ